MRVVPVPARMLKLRNMPISVSDRMLLFLLIVAKSIILWAVYFKVLLVFVHYDVKKDLQSF